MTDPRRSLNISEWNGDPLAELDSKSRSLLAVRKAGSAFWGRHNIRSMIFDSVLEQYANLNREIARRKESLLADLFRTVPQAKSSRQRHQLLQIKRQVFKLRPVSAEQLNDLEPEQRCEVIRYNEALRQRDAVLKESRASVLAELRGKMRALLEDPEFASAVNYSCPWLIEAFRRDRNPGDTTFRNEERGMYDYAARFFSKANPFHNFASIAFPEYLGLTPRAEYEMVVSATSILKLESRLLDTTSPETSGFVYVRAFLEDDDSYLFFVREYASIKRIRIKKGRPLQVLVEFVKGRMSGCTFADCLEHLGRTMPEVAETALNSFLKRLIERDILARYLVTNFDRYAEEMMGLNQYCDRLIGEFRRRHLSPAPHSTRAEADEQPDRPSGENGLIDDNSYYVNRFSCRTTAPYESVAERLAPELKTLKDLFLPCNNFADWASVSAAFIRDQCS